MKMLAIFAGLVVGIFVVVGLGVLVVGKLAANSVEDTSALTQKVQAKVLKSEEHGTADHKPGFHVVYQYAADGQDWKADAYVNTGTWSPGKNLILCVDPDHPAHNVIVNKWTHECGDSDIPGGIHTANPVSTS